MHYSKLKNMSEKLHNNICPLITSYRVGCLIILIFSFLASINSIQAQENDPIEQEAKNLVFDSVGLIYDLPHSFEETERQLHYRNLTEQIVDKITREKQVDISVFDYLFFLQNTISENHEIEVLTEQGEFLLQDLAEQQDLKEQHLRNSTIIRDENRRIIRIQVNFEG